MQRTESALWSLAPEPEHVGFLQTKDFNCRHNTPNEQTGEITFPKKII
jgi:hypothetical protein